MKKILFILATVLLIGGSYDTVNNYYKEKEKNEVTINLDNKDNNTNNNSENNNSENNNSANNSANDNNTDLNNSNSTGNTQNETNATETKNGVTTENDSDNKKEKAIDFTLKDLNGNEVTLSDFKGKKVFLNFWATWCPPCKAEMPEIEKLYQETKDSDLVIIAVEIGEPADIVKSFIEDNKYNFNVLLDSNQSVAVEYNISSIPTSYFIDEEGNIVSQVVGAMNLSEMKEYVKTLE